MKLKVCAVQESPVFFDKEKTLEKVEAITKEQARQGCELIVFPETFIPGYPRGFTFGARVGNRTPEGRRLYADYYRNSIDLASDDLSRLEELASSENVYLVIGITERQETNGSLYCSLLYLSPTDGLLGVHRKIKPTGSERIVWAEGDGRTLVTFRTRIGKLGGLICWENYMPLARMAMYRKGVEIYVAPTADHRERWVATMQHIALEGRCFVIGCNQYYTKSMYPEKYQPLLEQDEPEEMNPGGSVIVSPMGEILAGPLFGRAGILMAEIDTDEIIESKLGFDVAGHYARNDIFVFDVPDQPETIQEGRKTKK